MITHVQGIETHYEQAGQGERVLLLHGWGPGVVTLNTHLRPVMNLLARDFHVTALEFPAHGTTAQQMGDWSVRDYAAWVKAFILAQDLAPVTLVAHSFGGRIALWLAAYEPQLVRRMVLTGCAGIKRKQTDAEKEKAQAYQAKKRRLEKLAKWPLVGGIARKTLEALRKKHGSADYLALPDSLRATFVNIVNEDLRPLLPMIQQPTMLVWGDKDDATPLWMARTMEAEMGDAGLYIFEGRGHYAYLEEAPQFARIVAALIREDQDK